MVSKQGFLLIPFKALTFSKQWERKNGGKGGIIRMASQLF